MRARPLHRKRYKLHCIVDRLSVQRIINKFAIVDTKCPICDNKFAQKNNNKGYIGFVILCVTCLNIRLSPGKILSPSSYVSPSIESRIELERNELGERNLVEIFLLCKVCLVMGKIDSQT